MKIGIYGSGEIKLQDNTAKKARDLGRKIAEMGHTIITGGCSGFSYEAVLGAHKVGGKCIAYSPAKDLKTHKQYNMPTEGFSEFVFVPFNYNHINNKSVCLKYRNVSSVADIDAAIIIGGRVGTMNEFTIAYDMGKNIGILDETGGITKNAIRALLRDANKPSNSKIVWDKNPISLVQRLTNME